MITDLQPLTLGEILDRTVQLYRRSFLLLAGISALPAGFMVLIFGGIGILFTSQLPTHPGSTPDPTASAMAGLVMILGFLVGAPVVVAVLGLSLGATNSAVLRVLDGEKATIRGSYALGFQHFWRYVGIFFLQVLLAGVVPYVIFIAVMMIGAIFAALLGKSGGGEAFAPILIVLLIALVLALLVACTWIWLRFSLAYAASVAEDKASWAALQRSGQLSKGTRGRIFVMFLMVGILSGVIALALMIPLFLLIAVVMRKSLMGSTPPPLFLLLLQTGYLAISFLVRAFVMPVYSIALMFFYFDQRVRLEGYDIEQLMTKAGWGAIAAAVPASPVAVLEINGSLVSAGVSPGGAGSDGSTGDSEVRLSSMGEAEGE